MWRVADVGLDVVKIEKNMLEVEEEVPNPRKEYGITNDKMLMSIKRAHIMSMLILPATVRFFIIRPVEFRLGDFLLLALLL